VENVSNTSFHELNALLVKSREELSRLEQALPDASEQLKLKLTRLKRSLGRLTERINQQREDIKRAHSTTVALMMSEFDKQPKINMHWIRMSGLITSTHQRDVAERTAAVQSEAKANKGLQ
jgi:hypothetical protein